MFCNACNKEDDGSMDNKRGEKDEILKHNDDKPVKGQNGLRPEPTKEDVEKLTADATKDNTDIFVPTLRFAKVVKVHDGDSIHVVGPILNALNVDDPRKFQIALFKVRLNNLDTPEIRSSCEVEKKYAMEVKDLLAERILDRVVELKVVGYDKYGRLLADILDEETNMADWIVGQGLGVHYDGGSKQDIDWEELRASFLSQKQEE